MFSNFMIDTHTLHGDMPYDCTLHQPGASRGRVGNTNDWGHHTPQVCTRWKIAVFWFTQGFRHSLLGYQENGGGELHPPCKLLGDMFRMCYATHEGYLGTHEIRLSVAYFADSQCFVNYSLTLIE